MRTVLVVAGSLIGVFPSEYLAVDHVETFYPEGTKYETYPYAEGCGCIIVRDSCEIVRLAMATK